MNLIKRFSLCLLIVAFFVSVSASSEEQYSYIQIGDYGFPLRKLFSAIDYHDVCYTENGEPIFDEIALEYLKSYQEEAGLSTSGMFDFETLRYVVHVSDFLLEDEIVWMPMHGGKKYHKKAECSNMYEPRQIPKECAESLGFDFCKRCYK